MTAGPWRLDRATGLTDRRARVRRAGPAGRGGPRRVRAGRWWCAASRGWARRRCWTTWPGGRRAAGWCGRRACSRRWSWRSPGCISCARRCWTGWSAAGTAAGGAADRVRPERGPGAGPVPGRAGRAEPAVRGGRRSGRWSAWSTTSSGSTGPRRRCWRSWRGGWRPSRSAWCSRPGARATSWRDCRSWRSRGWPDGDARALLDSALTGPLDERVRDQIVAETRGNPLALLELPRGLTPAELAGGFGLPGAVPLSGRIEDSFRRQLDALPAADPAAAAAGGGRPDR